MTTDLFERYGALDPADTLKQAPDWAGVLAAIDDRTQAPAPRAQGSVVQGASPRRGIVIAIATAVFVILAGLAVTMTPIFRNEPLDPTEPTTTLPGSTELRNPAPGGSSAPIDETGGVAVDGEVLWAVTGAGILRWDLDARTSELYRLGTEVPGTNFAYAHGVVVAKDGTVWVATEEEADGADGMTFTAGLVRFSGAEWTESADVDALDVAGRITALASGPDGSVYAAIGRETLAVFDGAGWEAVTVPPEVSAVGDDVIGWAFGLAVAPDGTLWAVGLDDVVTYDGTKWTRHTPAIGMPGALLVSLAVAPDGDVWVASIADPSSDEGASGVLRYDGAAWSTFDSGDGLSAYPVTGVATGPSGTVWVTHGSNTPGSVDARAPGAVSRFEGTDWSTTEISNVGVGFGGGAAVDASGTLWVPTRWGIVEFDGTTATAWRVEAAMDTLRETSSTVVAGGTDILATTVAGPTPAAATCPAGTHPDEPGPLNQARPSFGGVSSAALDTQSGRLVAVDGALGDVWTFDVCTNTWTRTNRSDGTHATVNLRDARATVYDADSDRVVVFAGSVTAAYDGDSDTWTQSIVRSTGWFTQAVYDEVSGLIVTWDGETGEMWAYDVDSDTWTPVDQGSQVPPPIGDGTQIMLYDGATDRIVLYSGDNTNGPGRWEGAGADRTWVFDPRGGGWRQEDTVTPELGWLLRYGAYDESAGLVVIPDDGAIVAYDGRAREWRVLWENETEVDPFGVGPHNRWMPWVAYDPINERVLIGGGSVRHAGDDGEIRWVDDPDDVWAFDTRAGTWLELLPLSG
jgi:hypothetical protein